MRKLSRRKEHRKSLLMNLSKSLIQHKRIITTIAKAKELRSFIEPLITRAKENNLTNRRYFLSVFSNDEAPLSNLFGLGADFIDRPGGYTRIVRVSEINGVVRAAISFVNYDASAKEEASK